MKLRDFVVNSLPRVRSKKKTRGIPPPEVPTKGHHDTPPRPPIRMSSMSRESSVERASHVAVADVNWRQPTPRMGQDEVGLVGAMAYYGPPPGMVMSHSAEGISTHSLAVVTPQAQSLDYGKPYSQMAAISESSVNYSMPRGFVIQSQHHHRHSHQHDYHYVYHHHHHHQYPTDPLARGPLMESNHLHHNNMNRCKATATPHKSEPGFLRKSFASFKAMRKQRSNAKDDVTAKTKPGDENGKCTVCPYPQLHVMPDETKKQSDTRPAKPKRKGLKSLRKSKPSQEEQLDKSWFSDNDASNSSVNNLSDADLFYHATTQRPRFRECSVESCMSRLYGSQDGSSCGPETDYIGLDTNSLSGYESDLPRSKTGTGRTRSRIKTNPWLPSPQPSLNIGRRFEHCDFRESREDVMTVDDDYPSMPRSASFEHQRPAILSSFQSASSKGRPITRHRSLTPSDLKITLSVSKKPKDAKPTSTDSSQSPAHVHIEKASMNDLSLAVPKSRPSSILSPTSEFVILADNIEQLANNISFEYEDMLDTTLESVSTCQEDGKISIQELLTDEEVTGNGKHNDSPFSNSDQINDNAHSPDSGIGCLGSSDGDDLAAANAASSNQSPSLSSAYCETPKSSCQRANTKEETRKTNDLTETTGHSSITESSSLNWSNQSSVYLDQSLEHCFATQPCFSSSNTGTTHSHPESACSSTAGFHPDTNTTGRHNISNKAIPSAKRNLVKDSKHKLFKDTTCDTQRDLSEKSFSTSMENNVNGDFVQSSSVHVESLDLNSNSFNDFQKSSAGTSFSKSKPQSRNQAPNHLPPNITRSELTTPIESPTENWQCDVGFFSHCQKDLEQTVLKSLHNEHFDNEKVNVKSSADFPSNGPFNIEIDHANCDEGRERSASEAVNEIFGALVNRVDDNIENNSLDLADASVQTDFNDEEWHESSSHALEDLCDDDFDPIESTRRWLLTGNMQGSADTGYSSQPRDSQILMDDDDSITALDNYNDSKTTLSKTNSLSTEGTSISKVCSSEPIGQERKLNIEKSPPNGEGFILSEGQTLEQSSDEQGKKSDALVHNMFSGIESQFNDIFHQLWPSQNAHEHSTNKRDSSGSSTSTLISETIGSAASVPHEHNGLNELTPRNSFCEQNDFNIDDDLKHSHCFSDEKISKKKKTTKNLEPDYVNVPRKGRSSKTHGGHICTLPEQKNKEHHGNCKKCTLRKHTNTGGSESNSSKPSLSCNSNDGMMPTERADYLEFLKDAPLSNAHMKRPMFLIPGFGPIEMTPSAINHLGKPVRPSESMVYREASNTAKPVAKVSDSSPVQRIQSLISKGRSGSRSKWPHDKESHEPAHSSSCPSANKSTDGSHSHSAAGCKVLPEKPKRKNPRAPQSKPCPSRTHLSTKLDQDGLFRSGSPVNKTASYHPSSYPDTSTRSLAERVWQLQREKDLIYLQLREVQQEELSRQRQQLQHHRNVHSQRKDVLLETLRELKTNLEEQSRKLNLACNKDVYI